MFDIWFEVYGGVGPYRLGFSATLVGLGISKREGKLASCSGNGNFYVI